MLNVFVLLAENDQKILRNLCDKPEKKCFQTYEIKRTRSSVLCLNETNSTNLTNICVTFAIPPRPILITSNIALIFSQRRSVYTLLLFLQMVMQVYNRVEHCQCNITIIAYLFIYLFTR